VIVILTVVVVHMGGANPLLHDAVGLLDAFHHVGVAYIENKVQIQMSHLVEEPQPLSARERVRDVFQKNLDTSLPRKDAQLLESREGGIDLPLVVLFTGDADVLDQIPERNCFGDLERPFDFVHHPQTLRLHWLGDGNDRMRTGPSPDLIGIHRRVHGMELKVGIPKPVPQFNDLGAVAIVQMLTRAKNLYCRDSGLLDPVQHCNREPVVDEQVRGQNVLHA
jgi:hypothetical protein